VVEPMLNDPPHALLNTPTATAPLDPWDEVSIWTSKAWDEVSYNRTNMPAKAASHWVCRPYCHVTYRCVHPCTLSRNALYYSTPKHQA